MKITAPRFGHVRPRARHREGGAAVTVGGAVAAAAALMLALSACSSEPVAVDELSQGSQSATIDVEVAGPVQVNQRKITIQSGAGTGKHCHYGNLIAVVGQGVLTHYAPVYPGGVHRYVQGDSIIEGSGYIHEGVNEGDEDVVLWVTYVTPVGKPLAESELSNCDAH